MRKVWNLSPGAWISTAVVLAVGLRLLWVHQSHAGGHRREIAAAFGAVNTFYGNPQFNHDGSRFTYVSTMATRGCALYLCNTTDKQPREVVSELDGLGGWHDDYELHAWAWAPDDSTIIYTIRDKLVVYALDAKTKPVELKVGENTVSQVTWLTPSKFAFIKQGNIFCDSERQANGHWSLHQLSGYDDISCLTTVGTNEVAWLQNGCICHRNLNENSFGAPVAEKPAMLDTLPTNGLVLWLDASTLQQTDQTPVPRLNDLSLSHNHLIPDGHPPVFNAANSRGALNGRGTLHFASSPSVTNATGLKTGKPLGISGTIPRTVFTVMRRAAGKAIFVSLGNAGLKGAYFGICDQENAVYLPAGMAADNWFPPVAPRWNLLSVVSDGTNQQGFVNGTLKGTSHFPLNTPDAPVEFGVRMVRDGDARQSASSDGDLAEVLIYNRALDTTERQKIENHLAEKWFGDKLVLPGSPLVWIAPPINDVTSFAYSPITHQFLISSRTGPDTTLWRYDPQAGLSTLTRLVQTDFIQDAQWVGPNEFAYLGNQSGHKQIVLANGADATKSRLCEHGEADWFTSAAAGGKLCFSGSVSNEPSRGIWQYDLATRQLQSLVAYSDQPFSEAKRVPPFRSYINWPGVSCLIYPPPTVDPHKKYPLVITDTVTADAIHGPMFQSAIADCGAYVAIVERRWWTDSIEHWETNVLKLYQDLRLDPGIDPQQVYLFGASAETKYLSELVEKTPGLWKGVILLNPSQLPNFSQLPYLKQRPRILIVAGSEEYEDQRFEQFQANALNNGALVKYFTPPTETHRFIGKTGKRIRAEAVEHFIFEE